MRFLLHRRIWPVLCLLIVDGLFFSVTNPVSAHAAILIVGFALVACTLYAFVDLSLRLGALYGITPTRHRKRVARVATGLCAGLIALQSIGQLSARDISVLFPLALVAYLYVSYGRAAQKTVP